MRSITLFAFATIASIAAGCSPEDMTGMPDAAVMPDASAVCSIASNDALNVTFTNKTTTKTVSTWWVGFDCKEMVYNTLAPGQSYQQATFVNHAWRVREGNNNPSGTVLLQVRIASGMTTIDIQ